MTHDPGKPDTCEDPPRDELSTAEARARILAAVTPVAERERLALGDTLGRVIAADVPSPIDVPGHTNSAVDGYALRGEELAEGARFEIVGRALAGRPFDGEVSPGTCVAITTGAAVPGGADTVVMQEDADAQDTEVVIRRPCGRGDNVRQAGEDIPAGGVVARVSDRITPPLLGVLASLGLGEVEVCGRPRVAVFSTGDEIREPGESLPRGCVYDSNRYTLRALLAGSGAEIIDLGLIPDDREQLRHALSEAAAVSDAILTSGGVSVGEADFIKEILAELGAVAFWKLAIKPGRPLTFGTLGKSLFFGLPGNPVAAMVTFLQFVQPALEKLSGATPQPPVRLRARCRDRLRKRPGRREFQRAILTQDTSGRLEVALTGRQGSGVLTSMSLANCLIVLTEEQESVDPGTEVGVELLPWARIATVQSS